MGRPKAWLPFGGEVLLQRVVRVLGEVVEPVVVVAAPGQDVPQLPAGVEVVHDQIEGQGPLAGLAAGLAALEGRAEVAYVSACDAPLLRPAFVRRVVERLGGGSACVPRVGGRFHPLAAAYHASVLPVARDMLAADRLRLTDLLERIATRAIEPADLADVDPGLESLRNVNTPGEYEAVLRDAFPAR